MTESQYVSADTCASIRESYQHNEGLNALQEAFDLDLDQLRSHLYGECAHDIDTEPVVPPTERRVTPELCARLRERAHDGEDIVQIADDFVYRQNTVANHAFGRCSHDIDIQPATGETVDTMSADKCAEIRRQYRESQYDAILHFASEVEYSYPIILQHLHDECDHEVPVKRIEKVSRATKVVSEEKCQELRETWRRNPDIGFDEMVERFGLSHETINSHVKFKCNHNHETVRADEMNVFAEYLDDGE